MSIPLDMRIPAMREYDYEKTLTLLSAAITMFMQTEGVNAGMAVTIADTVIMTSSEDNLSLQDFMLFLRYLIAGKYGQFYGTVSVGSFMDKFEQYRQDRHEYLVRYREEQHAVNTSAGSNSVLQKIEEREKYTTEEIASMINKIQNQYGKE